eukprot:365520-Chlamydomonas_euryale.AAC.7
MQPGQSTPECYPVSPNIFHLWNVCLYRQARELQYIPRSCCEAAVLHVIAWQARKNMPVVYL